jgi:uncharacterized protein
MNPDLQNLKELQVADREMSRLSQEIAALPRRVAVIEAKLANSKARKEKAAASIKAGEGVRRKLESQIQDLQLKISKYRDQMLGVKTNQEYKALTTEVEFAQKQIRDFEDKILESMLSAESLEKDLKAAEADLKAETAEIEKEKAEARSRTEIDEKELAEWGAKRDKLRGLITPDVLRHYDRVLKLRGSAMAEAVDHKCSACQVMLRPQVYNDVRAREQILICDSCHRILWYDPEREETEANVAARAGEKGHTMEKAWYYVPDVGENGVFAAFVDHRGSSSCRLFDALTGEALNTPDIHHDSTFNEAFSDLIQHGTPVHLQQQPNLEEQCKDALPGPVLSELQQQVHAVSTGNASPQGGD